MAQNQQQVGFHFLSFDFHGDDFLFNYSFKMGTRIRVDPLYPVSVAELHHRRQEQQKGEEMMIHLRNTNALQQNAAPAEADTMPDHLVEKIVLDTTTTTIIVIIDDHLNVLDQDLKDEACRLMKVLVKAITMVLLIIDTPLLHAIDALAIVMIIILQEGIMIIVRLLDDVAHLDVDSDPITMIASIVWIDHLPRWHAWKYQSQGIYLIYAYGDGQVD